MTVDCAPVMTHEQEGRLKAMLEGAIHFEVDPPHIGPGCDNTLRLTRAFLETNGIEVEAALAQLAMRGGRCCDCEVLMNALR